ncbi:MAG: protein meaA [Deltaproteobacteria bacterium]|nr:protein meaA [Deltaproteobacteria bacterium]
MTPKRDEVWLMRTYSGHSTAKASNQLYRQNLAKGQTGLSVAFDLPTQTGYDSDHPIARAEVGKVGVPVSHIEDMETLFDQIPLGKMNTSMTINATAAWLLALYVATAEKQGFQSKDLQGTTQNDILKEYLSRGTFVFPPAQSLRLISDMIAYTVNHIPKWNPINICPYHLQEAGATPVQELAFGLANAICVLDHLKASKQISDDDFIKAVGRISFFMDSSIRFVEEICKVRAFNKLWDRITLERYGVKDEKLRRFRYGVQVNSLGLTERQPENNVQRILLEMLGVTLSRDARARAIQLPCWNEALGLPRPWDQQWSLRMQQVLAFETDLLEYGDIFEGSKVIEAKTNELIEAADAELQKILSLGGSVEALSYMKQQLVASNAKRIQAIESGQIKVVGVNCYTETTESPLTADAEGGIFRIDEKAVETKIASLQEFRQKRNASEVEQALKNLKEVAQKGSNIMPASIAAAKAGVTTGEWANALREVFGEYRAPTGVSGVRSAGDIASLEKARAKVAAFEKKTGEKLRILVGKPGLDGHSNGAEQIAVRARDVGMEVIYQGIRLTPQQIVESALQEGVNVIGLSILSGSHLSLIPEVMRLLKEKGLEKVPVVAGGIIPKSDEEALLKQGVARVYTPKDFELNQIMEEIAEVAIAGV